MRLLLAAALTAAAAASAMGQGLGQTRSSLGVGVFGYATDPVFLGAGPTGVIRFTDQLGAAMSLAVGRRGSRTAGRGEVALRLDLASPRALTRWYLAAGLSGTREAGRSSGYILGFGGVERGRRGRWWAEAGLGGGVRLAAGRRWAL